MNDLVKNIIVFVVVGFLVMAVMKTFNPDLANSGQEVAYSKFLDDVDNGAVTKVEFTEDSSSARTELKYTKADGSTSQTWGPYDRDLVNVLVKRKVEIVQAKPAAGPPFWAIVLNILPYLLFFGIAFYFIKQMQQGGGKGAMSFGRSRRAVSRMAA
jgi:cell division protease FtsH